MTQPGGGVVVFNFAEWIVQYPEFSSITQPQAQSYFNRANLFVDNTPSSPIIDLFHRTLLLNLATAHIATLFAAKAGQPAPALVGRISSASQGSVSVQAVYTEPTSDLQAFFNQTEYGAAVWAATTGIRTGFYVPPPIGANANQHLFGFPNFGFFRR